MFSGEDGGWTSTRQEELGEGDGPVVQTGLGGRRVEIPEEDLQGIDHSGPQQLWQGLECRHEGSGQPLEGEEFKQESSHVCDSEKALLQQCGEPGRGCDMG